MFFGLFSEWMLIPVYGIVGILMHVLAFNRSSARGYLSLLIACPGLVSLILLNANLGTIFLGVLVIFAVWPRLRIEAKAARAKEISEAQAKARERLERSERLRDLNAESKNNPEEQK
jgi:uncharacterized membrane protein